MKTPDLSSFGVLVALVIIIVSVILCFMHLLPLEATLLICAVAAIKL